MPERKRQRASVSEREEAEWELESARREIVVASVFGDRPGPRMCPWLLLCVSALPGWHQWHRHFPAASSQSWATAALPGANLHTHTHTHTTATHYLSVFPLSRPGNRLCVSLSRPGLSEPYDPGRASQTVLLLCNHTPPAKTAHVHNMFPAQQFLRKEMLSIHQLGLVICGAQACPCAAQMSVSYTVKWDTTCIYVEK